MNRILVLCVIFAFLPTFLGAQGSLLDRFNSTGTLSTPSEPEPPATQLDLVNDSIEARAAFLSNLKSQFSKEVSFGGMARGTFFVSTGISLLLVLGGFAVGPDLMKAVPFSAVVAAGASMAIMMSDQRVHELQLKGLESLLIE